MKKLLYLILLSLCLISAGPLSSGPISGNGSTTIETDPVVGGINGIVYADGVGNIAAAVAGNFPTLNQDTSGNAATCTTANGLAVNVPIVTDDLTATGGNATGLTNMGADHLTVTSTVNVTGATWTGLTPKFTFVDGSSSVNLTAIQLSGTVLGNPTQSGNVTHVLPAIEAGLQFDTILGLTAAFYFRLDPNANDSIYLDGVSCTDGKYIGLTTVTVGDAISCRAMKTGASTYDWACYTAKGAWACE